MPDWRELAPALRKFAKLIMENNVYSNEWRVVTMHVGYEDFAHIPPILDKSEALIADFENWSAIRNYLERAASQHEFLEAYPQVKSELRQYENSIHAHHEFFKHVFFFAEHTHTHTCISCFSLEFLLSCAA